MTTPTYVTAAQLQRARERSSEACAELRRFQVEYPGQEGTLAFALLEDLKVVAQRNAERAVLRWIAQGCKETD